MTDINVLKPPTASVYLPSRACRCKLAPCVVIGACGCKLAPCVVIGACGCKRVPCVVIGACGCKLAPCVTCNCGTAGHAWRPRQPLHLPSTHLGTAQCTPHALCPGARHGASLNASLSATHCPVSVARFLTTLAPCCSACATLLQDASRSPDDVRRGGQCHDPGLHKPRQVY